MKINDMITVPGTPLPRTAEPIGNACRGTGMFVLAGLVDTARIDRARLADRLLVGTQHRGRGTTVSAVTGVQVIDVPSEKQVCVPLAASERSP